MIRKSPSRIEPELFRPQLSSFIDMSHELVLLSELGSLPSGAVSVAVTDCLSAILVSSLSIFVAFLNLWMLSTLSSFAAVFLLSTIVFLFNLRMPPKVANLWIIVSI